MDVLSCPFEPLQNIYDSSYSMNSTDKIMWRAPLNKQYLYLYPVYGRDTALSWSAILTTRFSIFPAMSCYTGYGYGYQQNPTCIGVEPAILRP